MSGNYNPAEFGKKWAEKWVVDKTFAAMDGSLKPKSYLLIEFPYPSGDRLHVGHARSYSCLDAVARLRRMKGMNVLFPFGWDAFGLPAENYAIKTGIHPAITTATNIAHSKAQAISWGLSFDWDREINTTDPGYYKWTQWIFVQLFKKGLAYKKEIPVNWCPSCKINLANEEVIGGKCERCGTQTERRMQTQWLLKITEYADRLLKDLETVNYREDIKLQQINWIGKKEGAKVRFGELEVFTTRLDTIFGVSFVVIAPELMLGMMGRIAADKRLEVEAYVKHVLNKSERERKQKTEKSGVNTGILVTNPANGEQVPLWVAEYVMTDVGTGVVMGVPAHDERDEEFAKKYNLKIMPVVEEGRLINSGKYNGLESSEASKKMMTDGLGKLDFHYHLRDWVFSRQHYWGEPIPMVYCVKDGWVPVPEDQLPVELPKIDKYQPTDTGESPLATMIEWVNTICPKCGGAAKRETDTMPNWAGSSWYYLRYIDAHNDSMLANPDKLKYWLPVDWYNGGMEHTTLHLLYSRFWHKVLFDLGVVPTTEPYAKRTSHGVVLGPDGKRMSKSKGNVINPDEVVEKYGADTLRVYEMFIGPFDQMVVWSWESVEGIYRFLKRIWNLACESQSENKSELESSPQAVQKLHKTVAKIESDLEAMKFNTVVSAMMEWVNYWTDNKPQVGTELVEMFILALAPMAPFLAEELYQRLFDKSAKGKSVHEQAWPKLNKLDNAGEKMTMVVQVDGKVRGKLELAGGTQEQVEKMALEMDNVRKYVGEKKYGVVFVAGKILNLVIE